MKKLLLLTIPVLVFLNACNSMSGHAIKGTVANAANLQVALDQTHFDRTNVPLGKATCDAAGNFEIKKDKAYEEGLYRLSIGAKRLYFILDGQENVVDITGDLNTLDRMEVTVTGSETFTCYANLIQNLLKNQLKTPDEAKAAVNKGCTPLMRAFLATQLLGQNPALFMDEFKTQSSALAKAMPGSKYASDLSTLVGQLGKQQAQQQKGGDPDSGPIKVGMTAPDISLPGPNGKTHTLSGLRGKVVLLDFWASWCRPCRNANPHVVEMYKKYKSKGFDVFSVSLDRPDGKDKWIEAIQQDGLVWENHVSDLKFWDCAPAADYGVRSIPKTFLIGKDGKIVAVDPRMTLEEELLKVL
jgi:peroxiredoxin/tRNA(Leu) C34 or U34 (ribose-2'-O)-methylase TrmL